MMSNRTGTDVYSHNFGYEFSPEQSIKAGAVKRVAAELHDTIMLEVPDSGGRSRALQYLYSSVRESLRAISTH